MEKDLLQLLIDKRAMFHSMEIKAKSNSFSKVSDFYKTECEKLTTRINKILEKQSTSRKK